ncbi:hypothetical protein [Acidipila sp. EB88]|uniref:hypothetical protein n=1 Tax=Acidipila sp. EB88 TaxID=2305226 RepID=UPI001F42EA0D|nr:hypothetical protein [Acidipila sp. EB88]
MDEPLNLFGDETAFGLGLALRNAASADLVPRFVFEVSDLQESQHVLESFGLCDAVLIKRTEGDDHLTGAASRIFDHSTAIHQIILSGNARSIQQIKKLKSAKADGISRVIVKPYWSPGKTGMS